MGDRQHAIALLNQGVTAATDKSNTVNLSTAYQHFASACYADPTYDQGFYQSGCANSDLEKLHAAVACFRRALECKQTDEERSRTLCNLGWRLHGIGRTNEALDITEEALDLAPNDAYAHVNESCIWQILGDEKMSLITAEAAFKLKQEPLTEMALAFALLFDRQFNRGFKHFEARYAYKLHTFLQYPYPRWEGETDRTVFLVADQGLGDTLSFARFLPEACRRVKYVHAAVQPQLLRLFQHAFVGIPNLNIMPAPCPFPPADCWSTFVSLPFALDLSDDAVRNTPQIEPPRYTMRNSWKVTDRKLHVGIAWAGSPLNNINEHRSIPVHQFLDLYRVPGIQLYSLQVGERARDIHDIGGGAVVRDLTGYISDVVDTVSLLRDLDLVICCESALGHITSLAGTECWVPYSWLGRDYRIGLTGEDMIWTPKHRVFRQGPDCQWQKPFDNIVEALRERTSG